VVQFVGVDGGTTKIFEPAERVAALQRGSFQAPCAGTVYMLLDNTYSYLKQKIVIYNFEVLEKQLLKTESELSESTEF